MSRFTVPKAHHLVAERFWGAFLRSFLYPSEAWTNSDFSIGADADEVIIPNRAHIRNNHLFNPVACAKSAKFSHRQSHSWMVCKAPLITHRERKTTWQVPKRKQQTKRSAQKKRLNHTTKIEPKRRRSRMSSAKVGW